MPVYPLYPSCSNHRSHEANQDERRSPDSKKVVYSVNTLDTNLYYYHWTYYRAYLIRYHFVTVKNNRDQCPYRLQNTNELE